MIRNVEVGRTEVYDRGKEPSTCHETIFIGCGKRSTTNRPEYRCSGANDRAYLVYTMFACCVILWNLVSHTAVMVVTVYRRPDFDDSSFVFVSTYIRISYVFCELRLYFSVEIFGICLAQIYNKPFRWKPVEFWLLKPLFANRRSSIIAKPQLRVVP